MARGAGRLRAVLFDGQRGRGDAGRIGRSLELRGGRTDAAAPQGLSRPRQPPNWPSMKAAPRRLGSRGKRSSFAAPEASLSGGIKTDLEDRKSTRLNSSH